MKKEKIKFKIIKNKNKDFIRKDKSLGNICYPRFEAEARFNKKKVIFKEHEFPITYLIIKFPKKISIPKNRHEYGMDYASVGGDLIIIKYKYKGKQKIITEIEIIGK